MATELRVNMPNSPGSLASLAEALGNAGVNIEAIAAVTGGGGTGDIRIVVEDAAGARKALDAAGIRAEGEREVLELPLQHKAGELAKVARKLADAGVNVDAVYLVRQSGENKTLAFGVEDVEKARKALG